MEATMLTWFETSFAATWLNDEFKLVHLEMTELASVPKEDNSFWFDFWLETELDSTKFWDSLAETSTEIEVDKLVSALLIMDDSWPTWEETVDTFALTRDVVVDTVVESEFTLETPKLTSVDKLWVKVESTNEREAEVEFNVDSLVDNWLLRWKVSEEISLLSCK